MALLDGSLLAAPAGVSGHRLPLVAILLLASPALAEGTRTEAPVRMTEPTAYSAAPELALGDAQLVLEPRRALGDDQSLDPYYRAAAFAQLTGGGSAGGDLGVGAAGAVTGLGCDAVSASAQGRVRPATDQPLVGEAKWALCISRIGITMAFEGHDGIGLAPAIDARLSLWNRRYDERYERVTIGAGEIWKRGSATRHSLFLMSLGHGTTKQADGMDHRSIVEIDLDAVVYRYRHVTDQRELSVETLVLTSDSIKAGDSNKGGVTAQFLPVRVRLATPDRYLAAQAGMGYTGGVVHASTSTEVNGQTTSSWMDQIDGRGLPEMKAMVGSVAAGVRRAPFDAGAVVSRSFYPTFDGNLALEDRLAGSVTWTDLSRHPMSITFAPFIARTTTWVRDVGASNDVGVGASLHGSYTLNPMLHLDAIGELGRTPYTRLDGARLTETTGGQILVALSAHVAQ